MKIPFLPVNKAEMKRLDWERCDVILVSGDAYIDHPSFAAALLGRFLVSKGYRVGIIPQPDWKNPETFKALGEPAICFGITAGNMDSMINHYTAQKKKRSEDAYSPDGKVGMRPDRATIVYTSALKAIYKRTPIIIGGIEASLRRVPHYDYWSDKLRNSILFDSKADILIYGMGERPLLDVVNYIASGSPIADMEVNGTVTISATSSDKLLPEFSDCKEGKNFLKMHRMFEEHYRTSTIYQKFGNRYLKHNPPAEPLSKQEMDDLYNLPFSRKPHPMYGKAKFKAFDQIKESVTSHRGCFGGCSFCAIGAHQGKSISSRSQKSIVDEVKTISKQQYFHGTISDIGGPSANMYDMSCRLGISQTCKRLSCLYPDICPNLNYSHKPNIELLKAANNVPGVKHLFVASGIRFDLAVMDRKYTRQIAEKHIGGHLKLAPEHAVDSVLQVMQKPSSESYLYFCEKFQKISKECGKKQMVIPYLIVGHPGTTLKDAVKLALFLKENNIRPEQIQEFTPTPMSVSTTMYYTGLNYFTGKPIHVPKGREVRLQKALAQWFVNSNKKLVQEALKKAGMSHLEKEFYRPEKSKRAPASTKRRRKR